MSDGRILIGVFLCVDRDCNIIVGNCSEYLNEADLELWADARILGLALVPGRHIVRICEDASRVDETFPRNVSASGTEESQAILESSSTYYAVNSNNSCNSTCVNSSSHAETCSTLANLSLNKDGTNENSKGNVADNL